MHQKLLFLFIFFYLNQLPAQENSRYWIYFKDKPSFSDRGVLYSPYVTLTDRAIQRRLLRTSSVNFDQTDFPVSPLYINVLVNLGIKIHQKSRWLNAVSAYLNDIPIQDLINLPFVKKVEPVRMMKAQQSKNSKPIILPKVTQEDYGSSWNQNQMIGIPFAHQLGYHGEDILIALFDTGFILEHDALKNTKVKATWDFVNNDENVANENGDVANQHNHGTEVLGVIAGYIPGQLIGPAYASEYLLAKTEDLTSESHVEEDNWVAAAEWAEGLGADIISTSVVYTLDYSYEDMDGNTTIITRAADLAVKKGVSVFSSAGNEGYTAWRYIAAPADGDSVIAIGGVRADGSRHAASSVGPTSDGRIKPDLMAQSQSVYTVSVYSNNGYTGVSGTSYSCPLGAGVGAILLSVYPSLTPMALRDTLVQNATQFENPDTLSGYGLIDLEKILVKLIPKPGVSVDNLSLNLLEGRNELTWIAVEEISNEKWVISRKEFGEDYQVVGEISGRELGLSPLTYSFIDFDVNGGEIITYLLAAQLYSGELIIADTIRSQSLQATSITLLNNSPNPFNSETQLIFGLNRLQNVSLKIYDIRGRLIKILIDDQSMAVQYHHLFWDGTNDQNQTVSSGTYYLRLETEDSYKMKKIMLLK